MVICREIRDDDLDGVVAFLAGGFGHCEYWQHAISQLTVHHTPPGFPKYGFLLADGTAIVGAVLLIFTDVAINGESRIRCNVSSWYVNPAYRGYATILSRRAVKLANVTYFNVTPAPHTWPILKTQNFEMFVLGRIISVPILSRAVPGAVLETVTPNTQGGEDLSAAELTLLLDHQKYGCLSFLCILDGKRYPFVFGLDHRRKYIPVAHLIYCRDLSEFIRFAGTIGRYLMRRRYWLVKFHSNGPIRGIIGKFTPGYPKFRKGGDAVGPGDLAYSEQVMFGYTSD